MFACVQNEYGRFVVQSLFFIHVVSYFCKYLKSLNLMPSTLRRDETFIEKTKQVLLVQSLLSITVGIYIVIVIVIKHDLIEIELQE